MHRIPLAWLLLMTLCLAGCGSSIPSSSRAGAFVGGPVRLECAPFARVLSHVRLYGEAADWWWQANGRYARSRTPEPGSVLVFGRSGRLPSGHVAVVSRVLSARQILVTQANWVHNRVTADQPVIDVSPRGDWSLVRVWWPPSGQVGTGEYPALGFIHAAWPATHDQIAAATPGAIRGALSGP